MKKQNIIAGIVGLFTATVSMAHNPPAPEGTEKCYGIAPAGKNACGTKTHSCATLSKKDKDPDSWIFVPKGSCEKKGGKTSPQDE